MTRNQLIPTDDPSNQHSAKWWFTPLAMFLVGALAFLLYSRALDFAFFNDDPTGHYAWMESRSFVDFFTSSAAYGYYRPIVFVTLKGLVTLGGYNAALHHGLLLLLNSANVAMLWLLAARLSASGAYAWATALIFITFPFSYEAVAYVASLTHPLLLFWLLLTILFYQQAQRRSRPIYRIAAFITLLLGLFTHENGLFIPIALAGVEWFERPPRSVIDGLKRPFLPYFGAAALYLLLWLFIPKNSEQSLATLPTAGNNLTPFLQSLVYPVLPALTLNSGSVIALVGLSILVIGLLLGAAVLAGAKRLSLFALAWFGLSILPALLFLSSDYLYGSPRLHYLPAVGIAMLLALPVLLLARRTRRENRWRSLLAGGAAVLYTLLIALPPLSFVRCELAFYAEGSNIVRQMAELAHGVPQEKGIIFANVPFYFSSTTTHPQGCPNPYPWTPVGAVVIPPYATARDFVRFNAGPDRNIKAVTVPEYGIGWISHGPTMPLVEVRRQLADAAIFVFDLNRGGFTDLSATWQPGKMAEAAALAMFGDNVALHEADVRLEPEEGVIKVALLWQVMRPPQMPLTAFVHIYDSDGALVAQHDGPPGDLFAPSLFWETADLIRDNHHIPLNGELAAGTYTVATGLYNALDGQRLPAQADGTQLPNDIYILKQATIP